MNLLLIITVSDVEVSVTPTKKPTKITNTNTIKMANDYNMHNVSDKVLRVILSYVDYVNRVVLGK